MTRSTVCKFGEMRKFNHPVMLSDHDNVGRYRLSYLASRRLGIRGSYLPLYKVTDATL